ncbi:PTS sugar transporter subunit IIA [Fusibacter ferrireducens]|uniref:Ascorbate-specific PTS system EIIA component n=1 Tax=Fusibacter ferrireducens TaxID=2785058 RepID=A0ABR9ZVH2_9FIRM|nr:PTS sugar transporter subunit IIA [Fusibacter ferrireducens]MBF4693991.1 PTS sugar transporter subunit IIA [Fusibacter ferrireducens]
MKFDLIKENCIRVNVSAEGWEDAVTKAGNLLVEADIVVERYIKKMISNIKEMGPYLVIAPGIAMPHARPEDGVNESGVSLMTLEKPVRFGHEINDPVSLIVTLAAKDTTSHIEALAELMDLLGDQNKVEKMLNSKSEAEIIEIIRN